MRSFIKKLAGTMALTMVVSSIAPAGVVFADDEAFIAMQGGDTMVSSITLATGRKVDFRFVGAPANWAELDPTWTSSIPAVADVDAAGVVTAKKAGVTTITIALSNGWTATAKVTVEDIPNDTEAPVYLAFQNTLEAVTNAHVLINTKDGVDFWFINAPEGWEKMNPTWASSNTEVATVDGAGIVRGIADGFTTLTFSLNGEVVASTEITVGNPVVEEPVVEADFVVEGIDARYELYDEEGNFEGYALLDEETAITVGDALNVSVYYEAYSVDQYGNILVDYSDIYFDEFAWTSSDEEVVTVEDGVLTAVGAGEATLTVAGVVVDGQEEEFTTTVKVAEAEKVVDNSYEVAQASDKQIVLTFADEEVAAALKKEDLTLVKVRKSGTTNFAIKEIKVNDNDKTQVFVTTYAAFGDGDTYKITVGAEDEGTEFTTTLGYVDDIEISYTSYEGETKMADTRAFANDEGEDDITVVLSSKLYSGDVDVTNASGYAPETVEYSIEGEYDEENVDLYEGILTFYKAGVPVTVKATYTYEDANGDEQTEEAFLEFTSEAKPAYEIVGVKDWAFFRPGTGKKIDWNNKVVRAGDEGVYIVALVEDSYGNIFVTDKDCTTDTYKNAADSKFADEGYSVVFSSTDVSEVVVDDTNVKTWGKVSNAGILISLYNDKTEKTEDIDCAEFKVIEERKIAKAVVSETNNKILVGGDHTTREFVITLLDQDGEAWAGDETVELKATTSVDRVKKEATYTADEKENDKNEWITGKYTFTVDSKEAALDLDMYVKATELSEAEQKDGYTLVDGYKLDKNGNKIFAVSKLDVKYAVTVKDKGVSTTFDVDLIAPNANKATLEVETAKTEISTTINRSKDTTSDEVANVISFFEYQNGAKNKLVTTGTAAEGEVAEEITVLASAEALSNIKKKTVADTEAKVGDRFFIVYKPDGSVLGNYTADAEKVNKDAPYGIKKVYDEENKFTGEFEVVLTATVASGDALHVKEAPAGTYKAKVLEIKEFRKTGVSFKEYEVKFKVTNDTPKVTFASQDKLVSDKMTTEEIILDALSFKLGADGWAEGSEWNKLSADDIVAVDKIETDDYIVVKSITVRVRASEGLGNVYYIQKVDVNKTIQKAN